MNRPVILAALVTGFAFSVAHAAPIGAVSELQMSHSFIVNSGSVPAGLVISGVGGSFDIDLDATSMVDDPAAVPSDINFVQIGNPFSDPVLPFIADRTNASRLPGGFEGAASGYDTEVTTEDDPRDEVFGVTRRSIEREGSASTTLLDDTIAASAASFVRSSRSYLFSNATDQLLSFNVAGQFDAMLRAEYTGNDGIARAAGGFELEFVSINGATVNYLPVSPYLTTTQDDDPGAFASQNLQTPQDGFSGIMFNAAASAMGSGGTTLASVEAQHRYVFMLSLGANDTILLRTSYTQANSVEHFPSTGLAPVPLPAGGLLLLSGVFGIATVRWRAKPVTGHA